MLHRVLETAPHAHLGLGRADACRLSAVSSHFRDSYATWLFLHNQHGLAGVRGCRRTFRRLVAQLRRAGLFPLYALLSHRVRVYVLLSTFEKYKDRPGHFGLSASIQKFFSDGVVSGSILSYTRNWAWRATRAYVRELHHAVLNRRFYAFHQLCLRHPAHAAARYPMVLESECTDLGGLAVVPHLIHHQLWPPAVLDMLLRAIHPRPPALWVPALHTAAAACVQHRLRRAFRQLRAAGAPPPGAPKCRAE